MQEKMLNIELRKETGKNVNRRLRSDGFLPGVLYSHGESEAIKINNKEFLLLFEGHISESVIFNLNFKDSSNDDELMAFVKDYHVDPVTNDLIHIDLFKVTRGEKINTQVPVDIIGVAKGLKLGGIIEVHERMILVECLPKDLPEKVEIDVTELLVDDSIYIKDLNLGDAIKITMNPDQIIVACHTVKIKEIEVEEEGEELAEGAEGAEAGEGTETETAKAEE